MRQFRLLEIVFILFIVFDIALFGVIWLNSHKSSPQPLQQTQQVQAPQITQNTATTQNQSAMDALIPVASPSKQFTLYNNQTGAPESKVPVEHLAAAFNDLPKYSHVIINGPDAQGKTELQQAFQETYDNTTKTLTIHVFLAKDLSANNNAEGITILNKVTFLSGVWYVSHSYTPKTISEPLFQVLTDNNNTQAFLAFRAANLATNFFTNTK